MATTRTRASRSNLVLRDASIGDVPGFIKGMRAADVAEIRAITDESLLRRVCKSVAGSTKAWAAVRRDTGAVVTLVGVCPGPSPHEGVPWAHCTDAIEEFPVEFTRKGIAITKQMHTLYPILSNYVDERNTVHINWLRWMGYEMLETNTALSRDGTGFIRFRRVAPSV